MAATQAIPTTLTRIALKQHLVGEVAPELFEVVSESLASLADGEVLCRVDHMQIASAFTDLMRADAEIPMPPYAIGDTVGGAVVATVVESRSSDFEPGDLVFSFTGWSSHIVADGSRLVKLDRNVVPDPSYYLNQGVTAYHGMVDVAQVGDGDVVFVSGAAGGVGSLAGQIAKLSGAKLVIGTAGSDAKTEYLTATLGFDAAINYKTHDVATELQRIAPDGISVFYDNVGGTQFEAAITAAAPGARFALCGALSSQVTKDRDLWPRFNLMTAITKNLTIRPFATYHTPDQIDAWNQHFGMWLAQGKFVFPHTELQGPLTDAPQALHALLAGEYTGNVSLTVASANHGE